MPENIATLASASNTLDTLAKWLRVMEKAGVTYEQFVQPINNRKSRLNLAAYLAAGCSELSSGVQVAGETESSRTVSTVYQTAVTILGDDFIAPQEVLGARSGIAYAASQLAEFEKTLPAEDELKWLRDNDFMLIPGPGTPLSCLEIRELDPEYFYTKTDGWYAEEKQQFSREQKVTTKWLKLRKTPVPDSLSKTWDEQIKLISELEYVPNDAEVEWGITTYKAFSNTYLLKGIYVRTSSFGSGGYRVYVGGFDAGGLRVNYFWGYDSSDDIGVASARK